MRRIGSGGRIGQGTRRGGLAAVIVLAGGVLAAACSSSSTSTSTTTTSSSGSPSTTAAGSGSGLASIVRGIKRGSGATFSATYVTADSTTGKSQTVTFAQSSPKSAVVTPSGSFYIDGSSVTACQGSGASATCTSLSSSLGSSLGAAHRPLLTGCPHDHPREDRGGGRRPGRRNQRAHLFGNLWGPGLELRHVDEQRPAEAGDLLRGQFEWDPHLLQRQRDHRHAHRVHGQPTGVHVLASVRSNRADPACRHLTRASPSSGGRRLSHRARPGVPTGSGQPGVGRGRSLGGEHSVTQRAGGG